MPSLSLGSRLALIILLGTITTVGSVLFVAYSALVEDFEDILTEQQLYETRRIATEVNQRLQLKLDVLAESASLLSHGDKLVSSSEIAIQLERQKLLNALFPDGVLVFDDNATAIFENFYTPGRIGTNYSDRSHFRQAMASRKPVISRPLLGRTTGVPLLSFLAPIESDEGDLLGLLGGTINLGKTSIVPVAMLEEIANEEATFTIIDSENFLYIEGGAITKNGIIPLPAPGDNALIDAALSGITSGHAVGPDGRTLIYATSHLQRLGWQFVRAVPHEWATAPAKESFGQFFWISLSIALVIALISYILTRSAINPLDRMTRKINSMVQTPSKADRLDPSGANEVRNLAIAFNQLMDERDAISTMKDQFVSNVSHELRTPLTSINGALRLIDSGATGDLPTRARAMNSLALRNGHRLQLLISDLLDFSKLSAGRMSVTLATESLQPILESTVFDNQTMAHEYKVALTAHCNPRQKVITDAHRLRQILDNFVSNAIKFSPANGKVRVFVETGTAGSTRIVVQDHGEGVPETFVERLFDRFSQADSGDTKATAGTGLGLAICRELAALMNGRLGYYYEQGAHFWVELPSVGNEA
ncbi:ATP-binding protein [Marinobacter apostichopi]|uniref:ATP-binding protein n=1 Tax=Marinobacter apostichopi TaxID=3035454 RepID=UPI002573FF7C|nr:ATP-binding protein [Marinobacter sp. LA51]